MTDRISLSEYKRLTSQMSVSLSGRVVAVAQPPARLQKAFADASKVLTKPPKPNKYGAKKTEVDGITFDSKAEAKRYVELKRWESIGYISDLQLQPAFPLIVSDIKVATYRADFSYVYFETGPSMTSVDKVAVKVVEDVKGMRTPVYKLKKRMFEAQYGMKITEITK